MTLHPARGVAPAVAARRPSAAADGWVCKGGTAILCIDGVDVGSGRVDQTEAFLFSADETCDVGDEFGSPVTDDYSVKKFTGEVNWVEIDLGLDSHNHLIRPEDRLRVAMGIQQGATLREAATLRDGRAVPARNRPTRAPPAD